jgi:MoxR-like ATPase
VTVRATTPRAAKLASVEDVTAALREASYIADRGLSTAVFLALRAERPLLLEGPAGVGKTEVAKALAHTLGRRLIRLQSYEGLDASHALYEWDYARQLLHARLHTLVDDGSSNPGAAVENAERALYSPRFLLERPLLAAVRAGSGAVLLIDELDRADHEFEAFLLEFLADFAVTIPELDTIRSESPPLVVITSNRTRELHDALKRRCLFHWIDYPSAEREQAIIELRIPGIAPALAAGVAQAVQRLRSIGLIKPPGAAEAVDWARALALLGADAVTPEAAFDSLGWVVKSVEDLRTVRAQLDTILDA